MISSLAYERYTTRKANVVGLVEVCGPSHGPRRALNTAFSVGSITTEAAEFVEQRTFYSLPFKAKFVLPGGNWICYAITCCHFRAIYFVLLWGGASAVVVVVVVMKPAGWAWFLGSRDWLLFALYSSGCNS